MNSRCQHVKARLLEKLTQGGQDVRIVRLVERWPKHIQREIAEKLAGGLCGHGAALSKLALRRWRYLLKKLELIQATRSTKHGTRRKN